MNSDLELFLRILAAAGLGALVGFERERNHQPAGLRTHIVLVAGAALAMTLSISLAGDQYDPARLAAQVLTGVGFLGAGAILRFGPTVRGLTTAASLWTMAVVGLTMGAGHYFLGLATTLLLLFVLSMLNIFEARFIRPAANLTFTVYAVDHAGIEDQIHSIFLSNSLSVEHYSLERRIHRQRVKINVVARLGPRHSAAQISELLRTVKGVRVIHYE